MKVAIMQPYFFPYIGYFQLFGAVDLFVIYDNIKYTKKGWINRNRMLQSGKDVMFSLPLRSDPDSLDVRERTLAADFKRDKLLNQLRGAYGRAPQFNEVFPMIERAVHHQDMNLFAYLHHALICACQHLGLTTPLRVSSSITIDHGLKGQDKVIALSKAVGATTYVNAIGGQELYDRDVFRRHGLDLQFIGSKPFEYRQFGDPFVAWLSIIDVLMFNPNDTVRAVVSNHYEML
jgi:WbqC-like protein family